MQNPSSVGNKPVLVFATHNANKVKEIQELLGHLYHIQSLNDIGCDEDIEETASTLEGNAQIKALHVANNYGLDCFADDTGLEVDALQGAPGVFSARYAGTHGDAEANMALLLQNLEGEEDEASRTAQFRTSICLVQAGRTRMFEGICRGHIATTRSGAQGFGYDPVFIPEGHVQTFADMTSAEKNAISHRGRAIRAMVETLDREANL